MTGSLANKGSGYIPATWSSGYRAPLLASALLVLTLLQASSFNLSLAYRGPLASNALVSLITVLWLAMYAYSLLGLFFAFGINWLTWLVRYRLVLTLLLVGAATSTFWSLDTSLSLERSIHLIGTTIVALYLGFVLPLASILRISAIVFGFIMFTSIISAMFIPELGVVSYEGSQVWGGTLASKNTLGFWAAVSFLLSASLVFWTITRKQRMFYIVVSLLSLVCLYNSVSATSILALICSGVLMVYLHTALNLRLSLIAALLLGVFAVTLAALSFLFIDTAALIGRSGDLTGRGEVWEQTWKLILERPLTGYGYGALWYPTDESIWIQQSLTDFSWTVFHAHNGLLQLASEIGIPLTIVALLMLLQQLVEIIYCQYQRQQPGVLFVLGFVVALLISNYSEARLLVNRDLYWIFLITLPVSMLQQISFSSHTIPLSGADGRVTTSDAHRLRESRERKEQKNQTKERVRRINEAKIINPLPNTESPSVSKSVRVIRPKKNRRLKAGGPRS